MWIVKKQQQTFKMPGKEVLNGQDSSANGISETFLFTSESVGEGHPGNENKNVCCPIYFAKHVIQYSLLPKQSGSKSNQ